MREFFLHKSITNLDLIKEDLKSKVQDLDSLKIIAVSKTFSIDQILPLIKHGHLDYGENKVQEAINKWSDVKLEYSDIKLHLIGKLQSNKTKLAVKLFDYIHSVDSEKIAKKIAEEELKQNKKVKIFIQVNIGEEEQKSGIKISEIEELFFYCKSLKLEIIGLMCIPPNESESKNYFNEMRILNNKFNFKDLSMGMSADYMEAIENSSNFVRIGTSIFGKRN